MKIQAINNKDVSFQKLVINNPEQMPREVYKGIIENNGIRDLAQKMHNKGVDLIAEYSKPDYMYGIILAPRIFLYNAKQFFNKYFNYDEKPYSNEYASIYCISNKKSDSDKKLLRELYLFEPFDIREEVHYDVCRYFNKTKDGQGKEDFAKNLQKYNNNIDQAAEPKK